MQPKLCLQTQPISLALGLRQMFPKWWHSSHYFYPWASTKDLDTACIGPRPTSCEVPCIRRPLSLNRFTAILRFVHLANNQAEDKFPPDKLFKVRPLLDIVLPSFLRIYKPGRNLSPDETMVKFNGRIGFKQYMPRKAAKWGLKYFSLN